MIDCHIHILPGIDDGSQSMDESLKLARQCVESGVTHVVATPHGSSSNIPAVLLQRETKIQELREKLIENQLSLTIIPGLEYLADNHSADSAVNSPDCRCGLLEPDYRPLLLELPFTVELNFISVILFKAQLRNLTLILAHPERYNGFTDKIDFLAELMDKGLYLQFNARNFKSSFFKRSQLKGMLKLVEHIPEQVLVGSDAHDSEYRPAGLQVAQDRITSTFGEETWNIISQITPSKLLGIQ